MVDKLSKKFKFDINEDCCVCLSDTPPVDICDDIHWVQCEECQHWAHTGVCVYVENTDDVFLCDCCILYEE